uniref:SP11-910 protein n=1 Tax=Brassica napus TaxID=3708 RepID=Q8VX14_BRANA|nr:SP11-910 protein [Brassica napus]
MKSPIYTLLWVILIIVSHFQVEANTMKRCNQTFKGDCQNNGNQLCKDSYWNVLKKRAYNCTCERFDGKQRVCKCNLREC